MTEMMVSAWASSQTLPTHSHTHTHTHTHSHTHTHTHTYTAITAKNSPFTLSLSLLCQSLYIPPSSLSSMPYLSLVLSLNLFISYISPLFFSLSCLSLFVSAAHISFHVSLSPSRSFRHISPSLYFWSFPFPSTSPSHSSSTPSLHPSLSPSPSS